MLERLQKYLAGAGVASRRKCEELIQQGLISVNSETIRKPGFKIDPEKDVICINNRRLKPGDKKYYILNKPGGYVCSCSKNDNAPIVTELIPEKKLFPVGRLDKNTEGLIILTNDGDFGQSVIHPSANLWKEYYVVLDRGISSDDMERFSLGIEIDGRPTAPARISSAAGNGRKLTVSITEGRNRQIRKMFSALGYKIVYLKRTKIGRLNIGNLKPGYYKPVSKDFLWKKIFSE
ncbi:MAG: rRNA pseudouridine synthase [Candidatus Aureabacteria bacterium]|nr:rRNA pseudouridine synthase [Candidatus Auribacterota bacterium]